MSSYGTNLQYQILQAGQQDDRYMKLRHRLKQGTGEQNVDYHFIASGLLRFRDKIYVLDNSELKNIILREFHVKPYSYHPRYQKTLTTMNKFYYSPNLRKEVK